MILPRATAQANRAQAGGDAELIIALVDMVRDQGGTVVAIDIGHGKARQLMAMGIRPGVVVTKRSAQPWGGPITVQVGGTELALSFGIARRIMVQV